MKITIESTTEVVELNGIQCRVWEGETAAGVKVQVLVPRIAVHKTEDASEFERELQEKLAPPRAEVRAFPARMVL